jgi:predicted transcriptional regulator
METISFKISPILARQLDELALQSNQKSRHIFAKRIVEDFMTRTGDDQTLEGVADIKEMISLLREDLASAVTVLLVKGGHVKTLDEARIWAAKTMLSEG